MALKGVLFDFSGTLFRIESAESWLRATLAENGLALPEPELRRAAGELEAVGALPGGAHPVRPLPKDLAGLWPVRDRSAELHRAAYTGASRLVPLPSLEPPAADAPDVPGASDPSPVVASRPDLYDALYDRHMAPAAWRAYPDAAEVLAGLRERGIAVGVVSNIGWDLRPVFRAHGLDAYVGAYVLSYEHGVQKPDVRLFALACDALGVAPESTLMVGDSRFADGGAAALGCAVYFVDPLPAADRPDGLRPVLDLAG
jgi:putative hydrolase of the HAD superfamily